MSESNEQWVVEETYPGFKVSHKVKRRILAKRTKWQYIELVDTMNFGKMLIIDGLIQSSERDEHYYHEAIVHPAMVTHREPKDVLILGGGEGACLREVLKHNTVRSVVMVDIDEDMISLSKEYLASMHNDSYNDARVLLLIEDAKEYVQRCSKAGKQFDVIIQDLTDPQQDSPSRMLYTLEYFNTINGILSSDGIFVTQATLLHPSAKAYAIIHNTLRHVFPVVRGYATYISCYANLSGFILASKMYDPLLISKEEVEERLRARGIDIRSLKHYDGEAHHAYFALPKYIRDSIAMVKDTSTIDNPVVFPL
ncbi:MULTISPECIES: polyamine aminopropyltransferase [Candidatus Nitrosocaldus]|jgi:spermidine synthase|uniref:Polyamine aminopropyltransferase n=1 Tax=Candidatus Nitrosocaldus cavascurensis TaxID=2058097 RepID=A0A2K5AR89_9ARCH|nr:MULTISPECIES: polyamine aminopropyltransferase [Candidatus Nitrosocaldus]SPC34137.1 putative spermidine synthase [Candidatus Nitrosocaldus cavascurensis]